MTDNPLWDMIASECRKLKERQMGTTAKHEPVRDLWAVMIAEMEARRQQGLLTYHTPVTPDETVDWLQHAEAEFLDGAVYCRAAREVMGGLRKRIDALEVALAEALRFVPSTPDRVKDRLTDVLEGGL